jgi:phage I-like protein
MLASLIKLSGHGDALSRMITLNVDGDALPTEFRIFRAGENSSTKGTILFDDAAAEMVMANFEAHADDVMIDLEHLSLDDDSRNFDPDARGWAKLEVRNGELWAVGVKWTDDGAARLREKRQRFISPAFRADAEKRVTQLINIAITAMPATDRLTPLVAARDAQTEIMNMPPELLEALGLAEGASLADVLGAIAAMKEAAAPPSEDEAAERAAVTEIAASARKATGKTKPSEVAASLVAFKATGTSHGELAAEVAQLRGDIQRRDVRDMVAENTSKIPPTLETWALSQTPEALAAYLEKAPEVHSPAARQKPKPSDDEVTLTAADLEVARQLGNNPSEVLKHKQAAHSAAKEQV